MHSQPTYPELEDEQKIISFFGVIELTKGRGFCLIIATVVYYTLYTWASGFLGVGELVMAGYTAPLMVAAVFVALVKIRGHYPEWWAARLATNIPRPSVLLFKRRDEKNPLKRIRDSVQDELPIKDITWEWIVTDDGTYVCILEVQPFSVSTASPEQRQQVWEAACDFYRVLDYPVVQINRNRPGNTEKYTRTIKPKMEAEIERIPSGPQREAFIDYADDHLAFATEVASTYTITERSGFFLIPYNPETEESAAGFGSYSPSSILAQIDQKLFRRPGVNATRSQQEADEAAYREISLRTRMAASSFEGMGCAVRLLKREQIPEFIKSLSTTEEEDDQNPTPMTAPVTLDPGGFEKLSQKKLQKTIQAAEQVRQNSPPRVGTAHAHVLDEVSPDCILRESDYIKKDGRYQQTLYVSRWADEVALGITADIEAIHERITTAMFLEPRPLEEAAEHYADRVGELEAATEKQSGNVRTAKQQEENRRASHHAFDAVQAGEQSYIKLAYLISIEADSLAELRELSYKVWRMLKARSIKTRVAREEAWEGFLSTLPLAHNRLTASTEKGLLSNAVAALFPFTSPQVYHPEGTLVGLDVLAGNVPVVLDPWRLATPHSIILGITRSGKTFGVKVLARGKRLAGHRVVIIDPAANSYYKRVAEGIGGEFAYLAPDSPYHINPFDLHADYMSQSLLASALEDFGLEDAKEKAKSKALSAKVSSLETILELMAGEGELTAAERGKAITGFYRTYEKAGISDDPATHDQPAPTFADFFKVMRSMEGTDEDGGVIGPMLEKLASWESGPLCEIFAHPTNVDLSNKFLVLQIADLKQKSKPAVQQAAMEFLSGMLSNPDEYADLFVDEAHNLLKSEASAEYLEEKYRTGGVQALSVHAISQDTEEFDSEKGRVIINQAATRMIFKQGSPKAARTIGDILELSENETKSLLSLKKGYCYMEAGESRHYVKVIASRDEHTLFDTMPEGQSHYEKIKATAPANSILSGVEGHRRPANQGTATNAEDDTSELAAPERQDPQITASDTRSSESETSELDTSELARLHPGYGNHPESEQPTEEIPTSDEENASVALPALPGESEGDPCRIYAFTGEGGAETAASVADLLARQASGKDLYVLAVDATTPGGALSRQLGVEDGAIPDRYLAIGEADPDSLGPYISPVSAESPALLAALSPEMDSLPARPLREAASQIFDIIVVACGSQSSAYSSEWLLHADRVVGCSKDKARSALEAALAAETARGTNGTLLATNTEATDAADLNGEAGSRALFASVSADPSARLHLTTTLITEPDVEKEEVEHE